MKNNQWIWCVFALFSCLGSKKGDCDTTTILTALTKGDLSVREECLETMADLMITNDQGENLVTLARREGQEQVVAQLRELQYQLWSRSSDTVSVDDALNAIAFDNGLLLQAFIDQGFEVNEKLEADMYPSVHAIFHDSYEALSVLLENGADVHAVFDFRSLIAMASMFEQTRMLKLLLDHGADVNDPDGAFVTPLMFAAHDGNREIIEILIAHGADPSLKDKNGNQAVDWARKNGHVEVIPLLADSLSSIR